MYVPKNILVTGGCGFIGSHLANKLHELKYNVIVVDNMSYSADPSYCHPDIVVIKADILDFNFILYILQAHNIDTVCHLAAQTHVDRSFQNSITFTENNVLGTHKLLEAVRAYGQVQRFIHMSTDEVYGDVSHEATSGFTENHTLAPTNPYAATKAAAEQLVVSYGKSYNLKYIIIRMNNNYGPHQFPEKVIPRFSVLMNLGRKIPIHGNGNTKRNFLHVSDSTNAIVTILEKGEDNTSYNISGSNEYSVLQLAELIRSIIRPCSTLESLIEYTEDRNFNDIRYFVDDSRLRELGWTETIPFDVGLKETIIWYINNDKMVDLCLANML